MSDEGKVDERYGNETTILLHSTTNAMVWAKEWCRIAREIEAANDGRVIIDEGWMVAWFANAIEIGRSAGRDAALQLAGDVAEGMRDIQADRVTPLDDVLKEAGFADESIADASEDNDIERPLAEALAIMTRRWAHADAPYDDDMLSVVALLTLGIARVLLVKEKEKSGR